MNELAALLENSSEIRLHYIDLDGGKFMAERISIGGNEYKSAIGKKLEEAIEGVKD